MRSSRRERIADERFDALAEISPSAAVLEAWINIERALRELAHRKLLKERRLQPVHQLMRELRSLQIISPRLASMLDDLRALRNEAIHQITERQISLTEARRYKEIVDQVGDELHSRTE